MKKIRYNIAENRKVDFLKFSLVAALAAAVALTFITLGVGNLWSSDKRVEQEKARARDDRLKLDETTQKIAQHNKEIKILRRQWRQQVDLANALINTKNFPIIDTMELLEKHLPEGVFISQINFNAEKPNIVYLNIAAESLKRLGEAYESFRAFSKPIVNKQDERDGLLRSSLVINIPRKKSGARNKKNAGKNKKKKK